MKFDMNRAWSDTVAMLKHNTNVLGIVAAVFFFLPSLAVGILAPGTELEQVAGDSDAMSAALTAYLAKNWWVLLSYFLITIVGTLAVFALFARRPKPTVGESIEAGFKGFVPYLLTAVIVGLGLGLIAVLIGVLVTVTGLAVLGVVFGILFFAAVVIVSVRILLAGPIIAVEGEANPLTALKRSWQLVKGNTRRVFIFVFLIAIAVLVVTLVFGFFFGAIGAILGPTVGLWVESVLASLLGAVTTVLLLATYCAIYRQLAGDVSPTDLETFE